MLAKKSLGQHFLRNRRVLQTLIKAAGIAASETILEIGPGTGLLTAALLATGARVVAVEKDDRLIGQLQTKFAEAIKNDQLELIHDDILNFDLVYKLQAKPYKLISNIPYYLTGQILRQFLTAPNQPQAMVLMLQKEVAKRIIAKEQKESLLSISVKVYGQPHYVMAVPAKDFNPPPQVDSAIILIDRINKKNFDEVNEEKFFYILKRGFAGKRKMLKNNLLLPAEIFEQCGISTTTRAENLTLNQWLCLAKQNV